MRTGLVTQALRRHRWSLLAPACTQVLAACVISGMVMTAWSLSPSQLAPVASGPWCKRATGVGSFEELPTHERTYTRGTTSIAH
jgi:hypothetical protein